VIDFLAYEQTQFKAEIWATGALVLAGACCAAGVVDGLRSRRDPGAAAACLLLTAGGLAAGALIQLADSTNAQALALLALVTVPAALATAVFPRRRNLATLLWLEALALTLAALPQLLTGSGLVAVLAAGSLALTLLGRHAHEPRLQLAALAPLTAAIAITLATLATPRELFVETHQLWDGLLALTILIAALAGQLAVKPATPTHPDQLDHTLTRTHPTLTLATTWALALLALDTASTGVLQVVTWSGASYQSGEAAMSAVWSLVALGALTLGLVRDLPVVRVIGFAMIGVTLGKIFFYDLGSLSPVARALSFLAVGGVLLVSGFFYQRLTSKREIDEAAPPETAATDSAG
jgi:uncharacterized membrane protein